MAFTCIDDIEIRGGAEDERRKAAAIILAAECVDEDSASRAERPDRLVLRLESVDGLPEDELAELAAQFPGLSFTLAYISLDGEFYGYTKVGPEGAGAESEDFADDTRDLIGRRHDGDVIAFVKATYGLDGASG